MILHPFKRWLVMGKSANIMIVNEFYHPIQRGGAEVSVQILAETLVKNGWRVTLVCSGFRNEESVINGVHIYRMKCNPMGWLGEHGFKNKFHKILWHLVDMYNWRAKRNFARIIKKEKPDVIHTNNIAHFSCSIWSVAKKHNIPIVHTLRDYGLMCPKRTLFNNHKICLKRCLSCKFFTFFNKKASQNVDFVVGISDHILQRHLKAGCFRNSESDVVFNSISDILCQQKTSQTHSIGYLGKIDENKGIEILIEAFLACSTKNYNLLIAGNGNPAYIERLKQKCSVSNRILFVGKVKRDEFFSTIDLLVVPSIWEEPFGRTVIEPIAANIPVIAAASGGIPEILNGFKVGMMYSPYNVCELTDALNKFTEGETMFDFSQKKDFIERFSPTRIAQEYERIYRKAIFSKKR